jgi:site-specific recombinase XerD
MPTMFDDSQQLTPAQVRELALDDAVSRAQELLRHSLASNTRRAYAADWRHFSSWCQAKHRIPLPALPETVALYLTTLAEEAKVSTLTRRISAISQAHQAAGFDSPTQAPVVRQLMKGIRRTLGTAQIGKSPVKVEHLRTIIAGLDPGRALDVRDRALLLIGFAGAFRRSELVGLNIEDLEFNDNGLVVHLRRSKTDPEGQGRKVGIPYGEAPATCPVRAVEAWVKVLPTAEGPLFRAVDRHGCIQPTHLSPQSVALVVKKLIAKAGIPGDYAGHSLRAGLATAAAAAGVPERAIMAQTGHRSLATLRKYIREGSLFLENAAAKVGL